MGSRNETIRTESIRPTFRGVYLERFLRLVESIDKLTPLGQREAVRLEIEWCRSRPENTLDQLKYQALLLVLRDLMGQGWQTRFRQMSIFLCRPDYTKGKHLNLDPVVVKDQIRSAFRDERLSKINAPSTVRFIESIERPAKGKLPVRSLIAARPHHPVIGIAALGNCVVQLSERDRTIGWNLEAIEANLQRRCRIITRDLPKGSPLTRTPETEVLETERQYINRIQRYASTLAKTMNATLDEEFRLINLHGLATRQECNRPTETLIQRLLDTAVSSERERQDDLRRSHTESEWRLLVTDDGCKALRIALHSNKKTKIGCNMMDIIVCGAIPPYSEMLAGKLVAMLMASPQVVAEYRELYGAQPGEIASRLAGRAVVRPSDLVFLTTTSLYHVGSSQYERIRIPGPQKYQLSHELIGRTEGWGSIVLSSETTDCLLDVAVRTHGMRRVNNIFGEGVSPRLRMTREGLSLIALASRRKSCFATTAHA